VLLLVHHPFILTNENSAADHSAALLMDAN
jgi:hypothetical protein